MIIRSLFRLGAMTRQTRQRTQAGKKKTTRQQYFPEYSGEALTLAEKIGVWKAILREPFFSDRWNETQSHTSLRL